MASKVTVKRVAQQAQRADAKARAGAADGKPSMSAATQDSFVNFALKLGMGADNTLSAGTYSFNPITRNRMLLEWIHRGSWLGGLAVDIPADDMTREGIEYTSELEPDDAERIDKLFTRLHIWPEISDLIKWGRLYGGAICVALIDGQDMRTPLRLETVGHGQFKGLLTLDRWMLEAVTDDLVTEFGPHLGLPRYYRVLENAPALRGAAIHHSRVLFRHSGVRMPYNQRLVENLWGMSVIERLYDRMVSFDSATMGASQTVYKSFLRTLSIKGLRDVISAGGAPMTGLATFVEQMRRYQGVEGITMIDAEDTFETQTSSAMSGMSDILVTLGQQISGALQIPLVRLFGQSPAGLNSTGESDLRMYYDNISQQQESTLYEGVSAVCQLAGRSLGIRLPDSFGIEFRSLWQLKDEEKANISKTDADNVTAVLEAGIISPQTALKELRQSSRTTGRFTNITRRMIEEADDQVAPPPAADEVMPGMGGNSLDLGGATPPAQEDANGTAGPNGQAPAMGQSPRRRINVQQPAQGGGAAGGDDRARPGAQGPGQGSPNAGQGAARLRQVA